MKLNSLKGINANVTPEFNMNVEFVNSVKANLKKCSKSVDLTVKNMDNMFGLRIQIVNSEQVTLDYESGIDAAFLDAILDAVAGKMTALQEYDASKHNIDLGNDFKHEVLEMFLETKYPAQVREVAMEGNSIILEITFQLGYRRKLRIYFSFSDATAIEMLEKAELLEVKSEA